MIDRLDGFGVGGPAWKRGVRRRARARERRKRVAVNMANAMAWLSAKRVARDGVTVTIRRGNAATGGVKALLGSQVLNVTDGRGTTKVERTQRDFLVLVEDYKIAGVAVKPKDGDKYDVEAGGVTSRFEAMPVGSEASWRFADEHGTMYRIHAKFLENV